MTNQYLVRGCRSPDSKGEGHWDGAFVFCIDTFKNEGTCALFEDGKDFIGSPGLAFHIEEYNKYVSQGWIDMTINDIEKTSGVRGIKYDMRQNFCLDHMHNCVKP